MTGVVENRLYERAKERMRQELLRQERRREEKIEAVQREEREMRQFRRIHAPTNECYSSSSSPTFVDESLIVFNDPRVVISNWILGGLKSSPFERARLKSRIGIDDLDDDAWWKLVVEHWNMD